MTPAQILDLRASGMTWDRLAARLGVHASTARRYHARAVEGLPLSGLPRGRYRAGRRAGPCDLCGDQVDTRRGGARGLCARHYQESRRAEKRNDSMGL